MAELYSIVLYRRHRDGLQCTEYVITMLIFSCFTYAHFEVYIYYIHSYFPFSKNAGTITITTSTGELQRIYM